MTAESCPQHYNFHMHTICSDGSLHPEALIEQAIAIGLKGFAITDHHSVAGFKCARQWHTQQTPSPSITLWAGIEITARLLDSDVHILGYGFDIDHPILVPYLQGHAAMGQASRANRVIDAIHAARGIAVLAHPHRYRQSAATLIPAAVHHGIDGVEVYYAYDNVQPWRPSPQQTQTTEHFASKYDLLKTCGTDSHGLSLLHRR
ncbi:PHP domain-containing protein [Okeania sp. SIO2G5]|uniref:PHP domain-containing protein n=1 Tax=Okeania sp. SIO2G5 TaxID=2607796 RepID=UPI0035C8FE4D